MSRPVKSAKMDVTSTTTTTQQQQQPPPNTTHTSTNDIVMDAHYMDLQSRTMGAMGLEAMSKLVKMKVLIIGCRGLGVEVAKNLILAGPAMVTIVDNEPCTVADSGVNFFIQPTDVNGVKTRGEVCAPRLQELNRLVSVSSSPTVTEELVLKHSLVVMTRVGNLSEAIQWNTFCRNRDIYFIMADVLGAMGYVFTDFGDKFMAKDLTGEPPIQRIVFDISNESPQALLKLLPPPDGRRHQITDSDHEGWVVFEEVEGMTHINGLPPVRAHEVYKERKDAKTGKVEKIYDAYALRLELDTSTFGKYTGGGRMIQKKNPIHIPFDSLQTSVGKPSPQSFTSIEDFSKMNQRAEQLHVALKGVWEFYAKQGGRLPNLLSEDDAKQVIEYAKILNMESNLVNEPDVEVIRTVSKYCGGIELQPLCAYFGGVVAQEIVKVSGKFTPIQQWIHLDAFEILRTTNDTMMAPLIDPQQERYRDLITMVGQPILNKLQNTNTFMVGCGALGCEFLKNFALLGVATGPNGLITVTDNDRIEVSNLSRQFLFREENVGQPKSVAATNAAKKMNPEFRVKALEQLVAPHTESTFNEEFWKKQDFITNALDNVKARMYVDSKCVFYYKPLLESGTLGTKCNVQVILPGKTASYADGPPDGGDGDDIPMCTLRNFPNQIEHCIEWGRAQFTDLFTSTATETSNFLRDPSAWLKAERAKTLELDKKGLVASAIAKETVPLREMLKLVRLVCDTSGKQNTIEQCARDALVMFFRRFRDKVTSLIRDYPADAKDEKGLPFWSGTKRFPRAVNEIDWNDEYQVQFLLSTTNLLAVNRGLSDANVMLPSNHPWRTKAWIYSLLKDVPPPPIEWEKVDLTEGNNAGGDSNNNNNNNNKPEDGPPIDEDATLLIEFQNALTELETLANTRSGNSSKAEACEFEKDQDANFHIDFITASSNLRAWNYRLNQAPRHEVKLIAGRIIPALATTTASVCGLVMIEMLKLVEDCPLSSFKDSSNSLAVNKYTFMEPSEPKRAKDEMDYIEMTAVRCVPTGFSKWDKTHLDLPSKNCTVQEFIDTFKTKTGFKIKTVEHENSNIEGAKGRSRFVYWDPEDTGDATLRNEYVEALNKPLLARVAELYGDEVVFPNYVVLVTGQIDEASGDTIKVPPVVAHFNA
jgi:ubiquitin-activating enzyme E1